MRRDMHLQSSFILVTTLFLLNATESFAQEELATSPQQRGPRTAAQPVLKGRIDPHWFSNGNRFWYRNELGDSAREFIVVDALAGTRSAAFDSDAVATAFSAKLGRTLAPSQLPIDRLEYSEDGNLVTLIGAEGSWVWNSGTRELSKQSVASDTPKNSDGSTGLQPETEDRKSVV